MDEPQVKRRRRKVPSWLPQTLGYALSVGCLAWVLHGYDLREIPTAVGSLNWWWVSLAVIADLSVYIVHAWRWTILLKPIAEPSFWRTVQAIYIGLFANEVLPLRTGELIRCYLLAHWNDLMLSLAFASAAIERLLDGIWMIVAFILTATLVPPGVLPKALVDVVRVVGVLLGLAIGALVLIIFHKHHAHAVVRESRWASTLRHVVEGLHMMGNFHTMIRATAASLVYLLVQIVTVWALMRSYDLDLSFWTAGAVLSILRFGTVIPNAPGNLGLFQASCVLALTLFGVEKDVAKTFSFIMFFALTLPLLIGGAIAVALTGLKLHEIRHRARHGFEAHAEPAAKNPG
jgi:uncharacterized protein (TIRG00374 family)